MVAHANLLEDLDVVCSPFFLLVGASFMLVLVSAASVVLLAKVGSEALPSTLAALGGGPGHRKHD